MPANVLLTMRGQWQRSRREAAQRGRRDWEIRAFAYRLWWQSATRWMHHDEKGKVVFYVNQCRITTWKRDSSMRKEWIHKKDTSV